MQQQQAYTLQSFVMYLLTPLVQMKMQYKREEQSAERLYNTYSYHQQSYRVRTLRLLLKKLRELMKPLGRERRE